MPNDPRERVSKDLRLEGVVAKRRNSKYQPGLRSRSWIKMKNFRTQEVVIGGWAPGKGNRSERIGALLLGIPSNDGLTYVGKVGTGFDRAALEYLAKLLAPLEHSTSPFNADLSAAEALNAVWVRPEIVGEVEFTEWTAGESKLRHPTWRGLRPEKQPSDVVREK